MKMGNETNNLGVEDIFKLRKENAKTNIFNNDENGNSSCTINPGVELECIHNGYSPSSSLKLRIRQYNTLQGKLQSEEAKNKLTEIKTTLLHEYQEVYDYSLKSTTDLKSKSTMNMILGGAIALISFFIFGGILKIVGVLVGLWLMAKSFEIKEEIQKIEISKDDIKELDSIQ